jgi:hypothetical protein
MTQQKIHNKDKEARIFVDRATFDQAVKLFEDYTECSLVATWVDFGMMLKSPEDLSKILHVVMDIAIDRQDAINDLSPDW